MPPTTSQEICYTAISPTDEATPNHSIRLEISLDDLTIYDTDDNGPTEIELELNKPGGLNPSSYSSDKDYCDDNLCMELRKKESDNKTEDDPVIDYLPVHDEDDGTGARMEIQSNSDEEMNQIYIEGVDASGYENTEVWLWAPVKAIQTNLGQYWQGLNGDAKTARHYWYKIGT